MAKKTPAPKVLGVPEALEAVQVAIGEARDALVASNRHSTRNFEGLLEMASQAISKAQVKA